MSLDENGRKFIKVVPTYLAFVADKLNKIYDLWAGNNYVGALHAAYELAVFLPLDSKKKLRADMNRIKRQLDACYRLEGTDLFTSHLIRNRAARSMATRELESFVDKLVNELDRKNYLETGAVTPKFASGHLGVPKE